MSDVPVFRHVRHGLRQLQRSPVATGAIVVSLALGIGAATTVFAVINALYVRPLPIPRPNELAVIRDERSPVALNLKLNGPIVASLQRDPSPFVGAAAYAWQPINIAPTGEPVHQVRGLVVTGSYFDVVGVNPMIGRTLRRSDDVGVSEPVAVLSETFWRSVYGSDPLVVGRHIEIQHHRFTIVGVAPRAFFGTEVGRGFDVAMTVAAYSVLPERGRVAELHAFWLTALVRLRSGTSMGEAALRLREVQMRALDEAQPSGLGAGQLRVAPWRLVAAGEAATDVRNVLQRPLGVLSALVAMVLGVACANAATIQFSRASVRQGDCAVRATLGASTLELLLHLIGEGLVLLCLSATMALCLGLLLSRCLAFVLAVSGAVFDVDLTLDWRVACFVLAISAVTVLASTILPLRQALSVQSLNPNYARMHWSLPLRRRRVSVLVSAQVSLTFALALLGTMFVRSLVALVGQPLGFEPSRLYLVEIHAPPRGFQAWSAPLIQDQLESVQAVAEVAYSQSFPFGSTTVISYASVEEAERRASWPEATQVVDNAVSANYLSLMGVSLQSGRNFLVRNEWEDAAIVNVAFERKFLGGGSALGRPVWVGPSRERFRIVGVVGDTKQRSLRGETPAIIYRLWRAESDATSPLRFSLRAVAPVLSASAVAREIDRLLPGSSVDVRPLEVELEKITATERATALLTAGIGTVGLMLTAIGLGGVMSRYVQERRREIAMHVCLGATPDGLRRLVLGEILASSTLGVMIGYVTVHLSMPLLRSLLFGVRPVDVVPVAVAGFLMVVVGGAAAVGPLVRVTRIDPNEILRTE